MSALEGIIRPFQTGNISPSKPVPTSDDSEPPDNLVILIGQHGQVKTFSGTFNVSITYYHVRRPKEINSGGGDSESPNPSAPEPVVGNEIQVPNVSPRALANNFS